MSAAQHQDKKASGTISTYFRGAGGAIYDRKTGNWGSLSDSEEESIAGQLLMINHSAFFACLTFLSSDCDAQMIQTHHSVAR